MSTRCSVCFRRLSVHMPHGLSGGQPDPLRPEPIQLEERLFADAARRQPVLGQQPTSRGHPVPVLRPPGGSADTSLVLRPLHGSRRQADAAIYPAGPRSAVLHRLVVADPSPGVRCANPRHQPPHRHCRSPHPRVQLVVGLIDALLWAHSTAARCRCWSTGRSELTLRALDVEVGQRAVALPLSRGAWHDDLSVDSIQPAGARVERFRSAGWFFARTRWCAAGG